MEDGRMAWQFLKEHYVYAVGAAIAGAIVFGVLCFLNARVGTYNGMPMQHTTQASMAIDGHGVQPGGSPVHNANIADGDGNAAGPYANFATNGDSLLDDWLEAPRPSSTGSVLVRPTLSSHPSSAISAPSSITYQFQYFNVDSNSSIGKNS